MNGKKDIFDTVDVFYSIDTYLFNGIVSLPAYINTLVNELTSISLGNVNTILSVSFGIYVTVKFNTAFVYVLVLHVNSNVTPVIVFALRSVMFTIQ